jgi:Mn-dependent DtxR family transcriptional regulator
MAIQPRKFQHTFGRSSQTKALDVIYNERNKGVNIKQLSRAIGQSYQYTILIVKDLQKRGLVLKETKGVESILRPDEQHVVIDWIKKAPA